MAYLTAGLEVLALGIDALVIVDVVLPAVLGLVLIGKAGVEACTRCCTQFLLSCFSIPLSCLRGLLVASGLVHVPAAIVSAGCISECTRVAVDVPVTNLKGMVTRSCSSLSMLHPQSLGRYAYLVVGHLGGVAVLRRLVCVVSLVAVAVVASLARRGEAHDEDEAGSSPGGRQHPSGFPWQNVGSS